MRGCVKPVIENAFVAILLPICCRFYFSVTKYEFVIIRFLLIIVISMSNKMMLPFCCQNRQHLKMSKNLDPLREGQKFFSNKFLFLKKIVQSIMVRRAFFSFFWARIEWTFQKWTFICPFLKT